MKVFFISFIALLLFLLFYFSLYNSDQDKQTQPPILNGSKANKKSNSLLKEDLLSKNYYKAQKSKKQLLKELDSHFFNLKKTCGMRENQEEELKKHIEKLNSFLRKSLKDPLYAL